jgi:hypothetical protein
VLKHAPEYAAEAGPGPSWYRQQESNLYLSLRRGLHYPLCDGDPSPAL